MRKTATELAAAILAAEDPEATTDPDAIAALAACIGRGNGAYRAPYASDGYLVLRKLTQAEPQSDDPNTPNHPVLVHVDLSATPASEQILLTREVAKIWRRAARTLCKVRPQGYVRAWAPRATHSLAIVTMGGPAGETVAITPDPKDPENEYHWVNLEQVPTGAVIYRITTHGALLAFQRLTNTLWIKLSVPATKVRDVAGLHSLVAGVEGIDSVNTLDDGITLLCEPRVAQELRRARHDHAERPATE